MKNYFSHDYNARGDRKLVSLAMKHGMAGIGVYWCIVEMLYEEDGEIDLSECERIAYELRQDKAFIMTIIEDKNLFKIKGDKFFSEGVLQRIEMRNERSGKARNSAYARWKGDENANASKTHSKADAIKEKKSKLNKNKEKEIITHAFSRNSNEYKLSESLFNLISGNNPTHRFNRFDEERREKEIQHYCDAADAILRIDQRGFEHAEFLIQWSQQSNFWKANILSMEKFREKFDQLTAQAQRDFDSRNEQLIKNKIL